MLHSCGIEDLSARNMGVSCNSGFDSTKHGFAEFHHFSSDNSASSSTSSNTNANTNTNANN